MTRRERALLWVLDWVRLRVGWWPVLDRIAEPLVGKEWEEWVSLRAGPDAP